MLPLTAAIAVIGSTSIFLLKAPYALSVYCVMVFWYVEQQTIPLGPIDLSVGRIAVIPLLANVILRTRLLKSFRWNTVDTFVLLYLIGRLVALSQTVPGNLLLTREGGRRLLADPVIEALRDLGPLQHEVVDVVRLPDVDGRPRYQVKIRRVSRFSS